KTVTCESKNRVIHLEVSAKPYRHQGRDCVLTACRDISERVSMEAQILQQDRLASVGLLASSLAHEIGTPLGVIRGRAEFLEMKSEPGSAIQSNAAIIIAQIDRVSKLIRSLLNLARGDRSSIVSPIEIDKVVGEVAELMTHEMSKAGIKFVCDLP